MKREEAINLIKQVLPCLNIDEKIREGFETLIPELRESEDESEDERIRKEILGFIKSFWADHKESIPRISSWLAYLEKQKGASKAIEAVERIDKYIDEHLANAHEMKDSNPDKKYYRGWDDALGKMAGILQDVYSGEKQKESLRDFIDNFPYSDEQKEQSITANDLDEEIHRFFDDCIDVHEAKLYGSISERVIPVDCYELTARHFAQWAEKQKEQKHPNGCFTCDEYKKGYEEGRRNGFTAGYNKAMKEVEQKEQKPDCKYGCPLTDKQLMDTDFWKAYLKENIISGCKPTKQDIDFLLPNARNLFSLAMKESCTICKDWSNGYQKGLENAKEQKPWEWNKEERKILDSIIDDYEAASKSFCGYDGKIGLLRAIRDGEYNLPKPAEWNEEDEGELQNAIDALEFLGKKGVYKSESGYDAALQAASWLKNLSLDLKKRNEDVDKLCSNEWTEEDEEALDICLDVIPKRWKTKSGILLTKWLNDNIRIQPK